MHELLGLESGRVVVDVLNTYGAPDDPEVLQGLDRHIHLHHTGVPVVGVVVLGGFVQSKDSGILTPFDPVQMLRTILADGLPVDPRRRQQVAAGLVDGQKIDRRHRQKSKAKAAQDLLGVPLIQLGVDQQIPDEVTGFSFFFDGVDELSAHTVE